MWMQGGIHKVYCLQYGSAYITQRYYATMVRISGSAYILNECLEGRRHQMINQFCRNAGRDSIQRPLVIRAHTEYNSDNNLFTSARQFS